MSTRFLPLAILCVLGIALNGCPRKKVLAPPPGFLPDDPVVTTDAELNDTIAKARALATMDDEGITGLQRLTRNGDEQALSDLVQLLVGRGNTRDALATLENWVAASGYSERSMASYLDLALGADHTEECLTASATYLQRHPEHPFLHITRGVCLARFQNRDAATHSYLEGLRRIGNLGGLTGALELELGLSRPTNIPADAIHRERLALLAFLKNESLVGYVAVRHLTQIDEEVVPIDPRLVPPGGVASADLDRVFLGRREAFRHCQRLFSVPRWTPGGRLVIHLTIRRDGSPGDVVRVRSTFAVEGLPQCLEDQVRNLWFPQPRYGRGLVYEHEFRMVGD